MKFEDYYQRCLGFPNRYIFPEKLFNFLQENFSDKILEIGKSYLGKPIYKMSVGMGDIKVLAWSQMHGNESNGTLAMLDLLETLKKYKKLGDDLFSKIRLDFIFMLNPDGAEKWTRRNALDIDMNRDYHKESSREFVYLKKMAIENQYDYGLNLHEQRTIFSTDGENPATLSFLSPSENEEREITETRKEAMAVIARVVEKLEQLIPNQVARYSDEFYPTSVGDNFMKMGLPTILFEGGHFLKDYTRKSTRKYYTIALYYALMAIADLQNTTDGWEEYFDIPENKETHYDIIYRNVKLNTDFHCVLDIAIQYREQILEGEKEISFVPYVMEVGDCGKKKGWKEVDCTGKFFKSETKYPKLDAPMNFEII